MDVLNQLHDKIETMLEKLEQLELENMELRDELAKEKQDKQTVMTSIDNLMNRIREATHE